MEAARECVIYSAGRWAMCNSSLWLCLALRHDAYDSRFHFEELLAGCRCHISQVCSGDGGDGGGGGTAVMVAPVPWPADRAAAWLSCEAGQVSCLSTELCTLLPVSLLPVLVLWLWPLGELFESMCWTCSGKLAQWARQNSCFTSAHVAWLAARYMAED